MKSRLIKTLALILALSVGAISFSGCGESTNTNTNENQQEEKPDNKPDNNQEEKQDNKQEDVNKYPNVVGYPIEKGDIKECKLFINGVDYEDCNGYTKDEHPDVLFITVDTVLYKVYQHTCGIISNSLIKGESFQLKGEIINDKQVLQSEGKPFIVIEDEVFNDLAPELVEFVEGWEDYCTTTLFLEKIVDAKVHISEDRSAAYIEIDNPISKEDNNKYNLSIEKDGKFIATNKDTGETRVLEVPSIYFQQKDPTHADPSIETHTICPGCNGTGTIVTYYTRQESMYRIIKTPIYNPCQRCGGKGYIIHK